jgi:hypothetical protein
MNTIKWNSTRTGFTLNYVDGTKEVFMKNETSKVFVKIDDEYFWLVSKK